MFLTASHIFFHLSIYEDNPYQMRLAAVWLNESFI